MVPTTDFKSMHGLESPWNRQFRMTNNDLTETTPPCLHIADTLAKGENQNVNDDFNLSHDDEGQDIPGEARPRFP